MCGIAGLWRLAGAAEEQLRSDVRAMTDAIAYRGPDGDGHWFDAGVGVALGHRRLAIIDLSPTGHQPMVTADGRIVITYNGELYNRAEMAAELAMNFRGTSDTEVLAEAIAKFGIDGALRRANGLFAFAAYDTGKRILHLARDRLGIKPLYWTRQSGVFAFASELKALRPVSGLAFDLDPAALASYLRHACVPAPHTIFRDVQKLMPGQRLEVDHSGVRAHRYWNLAEVASSAAAANRSSAADIADQLDHLLGDSVARQMVSDVPLGAFLSGGIDSSTVVAMMQKTNANVRTFSIGFDDDAYDESRDARAVAQHFCTDHTELIVSAADAQRLIPQLPSIYDEPFADQSQIPTYLVSQLARRDVTVALSGDGGDENFGGYVRHQAIPQMWGRMRGVPQGMRRIASAALGSLSPQFLESVGGLLPASLRPRLVASKLAKGATALGADGPSDMYRKLVSQWPDPQRAMPGVVEASGWSDREAAAGLDTLGQVRLLDTMGYLPDDILTKVDRASMAVSLEVRVPLLDHRVVEFAWGIPGDQLIHGGQGKQPLRAVLAKYVPPSLTQRPKMGFAVPVGDWLRGPLKGWADDLLSPRALSADGLFEPNVVRERYAEHIAGRRDWQHALWTVLQFQAWRQVWR